MQEELTEIQAQGSRYFQFSNAIHSEPPTGVQVFDRFRHSASPYMNTSRHYAIFYLVKYHRFVQVSPECEARETDLGIDVQHH